MWMSRRGNDGSVLSAGRLRRWFLGALNGDVVEPVLREDARDLRMHGLPDPVRIGASRGPEAHTQADRRRLENLEQFHAHRIDDLEHQRRDGDLLSVPGGEREDARRAALDANRGETVRARPRIGPLQNAVARLLMRTV